jgi:glutathione S-transferase
MRPIIHGVEASPYTMSARLGFEEKGVEYELAAMQPSESKQPTHLARQPFGRVPVLEHDGFVPYESIDIGDSHNTTIP